MHEASAVAMWWKSGNDLGLASRCCSTAMTTTTITTCCLCILHKFCSFYWHFYISTNYPESVEFNKWFGEWIHWIMLMLLLLLLLLEILDCDRIASGNQGIFSISIRHVFFAHPGSHWKVVTYRGFHGRKGCKEVDQAPHAGPLVETIWWLMGHENAWSITSLQMACKHAFVCFCQLEL